MISFSVTVDAPHAIDNLGRRDIPRSATRLLGPDDSIDFDRSSWGPRRMRLVGTLADLTDAATAVNTVLSVARWNLQIIYRVDPDTTGLTSSTRNTFPFRVRQLTITTKGDPR